MSSHKSAYEVLHKQPAKTKKEKKISCCFKLWLVLFSLVIIALFGFIIWMTVRPGKNGGVKDESKNGTPRQSENLAVTSKSGKDICKLPLVVGPCRAAMRRFGFDQATGTCKMFIYGGCQANANNFKTEEECKEQCGSLISQSSNVLVVSSVCQQPKKEGHCPGSIPHFYFDVDQQACKEFNYGGCDGNENNFETLELCQQTCPAEPSDNALCSLPVDKGSCNALHKRFYFDPAQGDCIQFMYGGCLGNANNFETIEECRQKCQSQVPRTIPDTELPESAPCSQKIETGPCRAIIKRYAYDEFNGKCIEFAYGGCGGNTNNFKTKEECAKKCETNTKKNVPARCFEPKEPGPCLALIERFAYNPAGYCERFDYGGCQGNGNNFETLSDCDRTCGIKVLPVNGPALTPDVCSMPEDMGPCRGRMIRYRYDPGTKQCVMFTYGGCRGNGNNFESLDACNAKCGGNQVSGYIPGPQTGPSVKSPERSPCSQSIETGPCRAVFKRYGYNEFKGKCMEFTYGGCGGNANNFKTMEECAKQCETNTKENVPAKCFEPKKTGPCLALIERFAYNPAGFCERFDYGGCEANGNNFETLAECNRVCGVMVRPMNGPAQTPDVCNLPEDMGPCRGRMIRYRYDPGTKQCVTFTYGGCRGNGNNFETLEACNAKCGMGSSSAPQKEKSVCLLPREVGPCRASMRRFAYDHSSGRCVEFIYGGCRGNANNFLTQSDCEQQCAATATTGRDENICLLPGDKGPCYAMLQRYRFEPASNTCVAFIYGGCQGNANNFETMEACENRCQGHTPPNLMAAPAKDVPDICRQPKDVGPCRAAIWRFAYDTSTRSCLKFMYGGCLGNENNFKSKALCEITCIGEAKPKMQQNPTNTGTEVCKQPEDSGPCRVSVERYTYDSATGGCKKFIYGGCLGNQNNFETKEDCEAMCVGRTPGILNSKPVKLHLDVCQQPIDAGPCRAQMWRYAYDSSKQSCVKFMFGGCLGSENNFESREACEAKCAGNQEVRPVPLPVVPTRPVDVCEQPIEPGPCKANIQRYAYEPSQKQCLEFIYGGCRGNENNFETRAACELKCTGQTGAPLPSLTSPAEACNQPVEQGPCKAYQRRYAFNPSSKRCLEFIYGGCHGNKNNFETKADCESKCLDQTVAPLPSLTSPAEACNQPVEQGPCKAYQRRYAFNPSTKRCLEFVYGGCHGNKNNFETKADCESKCLGTQNLPVVVRPTSPESSAACYQPKEPGPCKASLPRFAYDPSERRCLPFTYGGCWGNDNNFETLQDCETKCLGLSPSRPKPEPLTRPESLPRPMPPSPTRPDDVCMQPQLAGPCRESLRRYAFDPLTRRCQQFIYGGCSGNNNNFETLEACESRCLGRLTHG